MNRASSSRKPKSILVVEDEFLIALEMESMLTSHGFAVVGPVASVSGALEILERNRPDAAVLDVNLQGKAVTPVASALRAMNIPFVIASAYFSTDLPDTLRGAVNVGKPIKRGEFLETLRRLIDSGL